MGTKKGIDLLDTISHNFHMTSDPSIPSADALRVGKVACCRNSSGWWVYFPAERGGKPVRGRKRFGTEAAARAFATEIAREIDRSGESAVILPREVRQAYRTYREYAHKFAAKGVGIPPFEALVSQALEAMAAEIIPTELTVAEGVEQFLESRKASMSPAGYRGLLSRLRRFSRDHGDRVMRMLTGPQIDEWLSGLARQRKPKGESGSAGLYDLSAHALNHYRAALATFFGHAAKVGWIPANPVKTVKRVQADAPEVLKPEQAEAVMWTAYRQDPRVLPVLALQMFGGLRIAEAAQINLSTVVSPESVSFEITTTAGKARKVPVNDALTSWLAVSEPQSGTAWSGSTESLRMRISNVLIDSGVRPNAESPRITCLRYRLQMTGSLDQVVAETGARYAFLEHLTSIPVTSGDVNQYYNLKPTRGR